MAAENMGGEIVYEDSQYLIFTIPGSGGRTWCKLNVNTGLGQQYLVIVDEKSLKPVMAPGTVSISSKGMTPVSKTNLKSSPEIKQVTELPKVTSKTQPVTGKNLGQVETVPNEQVNTTTMETSHEIPEDSQPQSEQTSPLLKPDFEITDIAYWPERTRIRIKVKNSGRPYQGSLDFRLNMADPYSPWTLDKPMSVPVDLNTTDNEWVTLLSDFTWPSPVDYPTLNAVAAADPDNRVQENDERNNHFNKTMRVNCEIHIEALSNQHLVKGKGE